MVVVSAADHLAAVGAQTSISISAFTLSGMNRSLVCDFAIRRNSSISISAVSRSADSFASEIEIADILPRVKAGLWGTSGATEPTTSSAAMTGTLSASEDQWIFGYRALTGTDQTAARFDGHQSTSSTGWHHKMVSEWRGGDRNSSYCRRDDHP